MNPQHSSSLINPNTTLYKSWRQQKLDLSKSLGETNPDDLFIPINDPHSLTKTEHQEILGQCVSNSLCLYRLIDTDRHNNKASIHQLANQLGLQTLVSNICADPDKLSAITQKDQKNRYIPYTNKKLSWHTDGYYNTPSKQINAMLLHCAQPAKTGGETHLLDHEMAYLLLNDENPEYVQALMQADAMTIPANIDKNGKILRAAQTGPVFSVNPLGQLHMRYTARKRNIEWKQTTPILEAVEFINSLLDSQSKYIIRLTLKAGEGLICRNVLHCRTSFVDFEKPDKKRLLYRGRYSDHLTLNQ